MTKGKDLHIAAIASLCLIVVVLFLTMPINSSPDMMKGDSPDDRLLDNSSTTLIYDSGWFDIANKQGQRFTLTHGLGISNWDSTDIIVEIIGKTDLTGRLLRYLGLKSGLNKTYGHSNYDEGHFGLVQTSDGGFAVAGETFSFGNSGPDCYLLRTDADGNMLWEKAYGGISWDKCYSMIQAKDGGFALAGYTWSFGAGGYDFWLIKTDVDGNMEWNKTYGGAYDEIAYSVIQTDDGGYALAGQTYSFGVGSGDFWLVKTDLSGNQQWNFTYGGGNNDFARCVIQTNDGGYAIAGYTWSFGAGASDSWFIKTDLYGNAQWNTTYGGTGKEETMSIIQKDNGGFVLLGYTDSFGAGSDDFWLVDTDSLGKENWNKTYGGSSIEVPWHMVQTDDGGYALVGHTFSFGSGINDFWLVKTDSSGNQEWDKTYGGTDYDEARYVIQTSDGGYALSGRTYSFGAGLSDVWLIKVDATGNCAESGLVWIDSAAETITLYRGAGDPYWNFLRVRIWETN